MAENKTRPTELNVLDFLNSVEHKTRREDGFDVLGMMEEITSEQPVMWGDSIVGFGQCHYRYESGREGDMPLIAFSPRKQSMTLYVLPFEDDEALLAALGKHKTSKSCLYINKLADVDEDVLRRMIQRSYEHAKKTYQ